MAGGKKNKRGQKRKTPADSLPDHPPHEHKDGLIIVPTYPMEFRAYVKKRWVGQEI